MGVQMGMSSEPAREGSQAPKATPLGTGIRELPQVSRSIKEARWEQESTVCGHGGAYKGITGLETDLWKWLHPSVMLLKKSLHCVLEGGAFSEL